MEAPRSYEVFTREWVQPVRKVEAYLEHLGVNWRKFSVSLSNDQLVIAREGLRNNDVDELTAWEWEQFRRCLVQSDLVEFDLRHQEYTLDVDDVDDLLEQNGFDYAPEEDAWVLRYLIYAKHMHRGEVAERLGVARHTVTRWAQKLDVSESWKESEIMDYLYNDCEMTIKQVGEELGCAPSTVSKWLDKHGLREKRTKGDLDRENVAQLLSEGHSFREIGRRLGVSVDTVSNWVDRWGLERPEPSEEVRYRSAKGYPCWIVEVDGKKRKIRVHRLAAVAKWGLDAMDGKVVHHKNGVSWDSSLSNLELMKNEVHAKHHNH